MSLLNPGLYSPQPQRQAASLKATLTWYARNIWQVLEAAGNRRAAAELKRQGLRMKRDGHPAADDLLQTAREYSQR